jgi:pseudouridine-5'-phosphate glycosidase/pseudouridine kinase
MKAARLNLLARPHSLWSAYGTASRRPAGFLNQSSSQTRFFSSKPAARSAIPGLSERLWVSEEVSDAVATNKPVVALESTIYTHGALGNDLAKEHSDLVRSQGGIPAIIAIVDGVPKVGASPEEIIRMIGDKRTVKASRRDIAYLVGMVSMVAIAFIFHIL